MTITAKDNANGSNWRFLSIILLFGLYYSEPARVNASGGPAVLLAQVTRRPAASGTTGGSTRANSTNETFQIIALAGVCVVVALVFLLLCYLVLFPQLLNAYWPRTAYGITSGLFWFLTSAVVLAVFWNRLKVAGGSWHHAHGLRTLVAAQGIIIAIVFMSIFRSRRVQ